MTALEVTCEKLTASGIQPFSNSYAEWWALGTHSFNIPLAHQPDPQKFIDDIAAENIKFKDNPIASGWVKLLDLTVKYGQINPTTTGDYTTSVSTFLSGKAAMIQQGNWIQPDIDKFNVNIDVGFIPMPVSDNPEEKVNAGIPNYWVVNKESKVKDEAKAWLNWMVTSETGKHYIVDELKFIPAFKSIKPTNYKGLNAALYEYIAAGKTYSWEFPKLPGGATELIGAALMKYLGKQSTVDELYEAIDKAIIEKAENAVK
jgi:raffinose/stachyose/melibiose transport system substrate-binding protein